MIYFFMEESFVAELSPVANKVSQDCNCHHSRTLLLDFGVQICSLRRGWALARVNYTWVGVINGEVDLHLKLTINENALYLHD